MIFFLHGADTYRARLKLAEIREKYEATYPRAVHVRDFDCEEAETHEAQNAVNSLSMFEKKKLLIFRNVFGKSAFEDFFFGRRAELAKSASLVIVLFESGEIKTKTDSKLYQWLRKNAKHQEFLPLTSTQTKAWIEREFLRYNLKAGPRVQEEMARAIGNNLWQLSAEIRKIASWKGVQKGAPDQVKPSDMEMLLAMPAAADIFATIEEAARKNKKQALGLLYRHLQRGDSPLYLLTMFSYQFRMIAQILDMAERKLSYEAMLKKIKLHPYALKKGLQLARIFSRGELIQTYQKLFALDRDCKMGKRDSEGALTLFVASL